jgi:hypothetical protein
VIWVGIHAARALQTKRTTVQQSLQALATHSRKGFFVMYTQAQTQALLKFKQALQDYNQGHITVEQYAEITLPLWNEINQLFDRNQKSR